MKEVVKGVDHSDRAHSKLGASSSHRWMNCAGSVALCEAAPPQKGSWFAREGTFAHELAEHCLVTDTKAEDHLNATFDSDEFKVHKELAEAVQVYVDFVLALFIEAGKNWKIENRFTLHHLHPEFFGTNDAIVWEDFGTLHVIDYKHGAGIAVEVEENSQLLFYALGGMDLGDFDKVVLHVVQPRAFHPDGPIRSWETTPEYVLNFGKLLAKKAYETELPNAPLNPGEWCRWCAAKQTCPEIQKQALEVAMAEFDDDNKQITVPNAGSLTNEQIARVVSNKKLLETFIKNCEEIVYERLINGEEVPGCKLVEKRKKKVWRDEAEIVDRFSKVAGEKLYKRTLISVAQLSKLVPAKDLEPLYNTVDMGLTVAAEADRRKPARIAAAKEFDGPNPYDSEEF